MKYVSLGDALPPDCAEKVFAAIQAHARGTLDLGGKSFREHLRDTALVPHKAELEGTWDLDYLSYAIAFSLDQAGHKGFL